MGDTLRGVHKQGNGAVVFCNSLPSQRLPLQRMLALSLLGSVHRERFTLLAVLGLLICTAVQALN